MTNIEEVNEVSQSSYNSNSSLYDNVRPGYIREAVETLLAKLHVSPGTKIVELAAGTGKFTRAMIEALEELNNHHNNHHVGHHHNQSHNIHGHHEHGHDHHHEHGEGHEHHHQAHHHAAPSLVNQDIIAIEPSEGMREVFKTKIPGVSILDGSSYNIPLPDGSADVVIIAQAFHWFANQESLKEISRVLRKDGKVGLIWNLDAVEKLDENNVQKRIADYIWTFDINVPQYRRMEWVKALKECKEFRYPYEEEFFEFQLPAPKKAEYFWKYWESRSYITALDKETKEQVRNRVYEIFDECTKGIESESVPLRRGVHLVWMQKLPSA